MVANQSKPAFGLKPPPVESDDSGRLLATVLERMQAEGRDSGGVWVAEYAKNPAFLMQTVVVKVDVGLVRQGRADGGLAGFVAALHLGVVPLPVKV
jgi:hypothetical protein